MSTRLLVGLLGVALAAASGCGSDTSKPPSTGTLNLVFDTQPPATVAGHAIHELRVSLRDTQGRRVTEPGAIVTLGLASAPEGLSFTERQAPLEDGVAAFSGITLTQAGAGYTFEARKGSLRQRSVAFTITAAAASKLALVSGPVDATVDGFLPEVRVAVQDTFGNTVQDGAGEISVALASGPAGTTLSGQTAVGVQGGLASFSQLALDRPGEYTLVLSASGLAPVTSPLFHVTHGVPARLAFLSQPSSTRAGEVVAPAIHVQLLDAKGNAALTVSTDVTLALGNNPGGATLGGSLAARAAEGVATFSDVRLDKSGAGYSLRATAGGLQATSEAFDIRPAAPARLLFSQQPVDGPANTPQPNAPTVQAVDGFGNPTPEFEGPVTLSLGSNPNSANLSGTLTVHARAGTAAFPDVRVDRSGTGYTLLARSEALMPGQSAPFGTTLSGPTLVYTNPATGRIRLVYNPASTGSTLVLDLVAAEPVTGYGVGFNLPVDIRRVQLSATPMVPGTVLPAGTQIVAARAALPSSGPLQGILSSGQSQKASGEGAVATDTVVAGGGVFYTLQLELAAAATPGIVFDGTQLGMRFNALLRDKLGNDVVKRSEFGIGRLEVTAP